MNWDALIRRALVLGLPPEGFWRLSVKEWRAITAPTGPEPLSRTEFEALSAAYPDFDRHPGWSEAQGRDPEGGALLGPG